MLGIFMTSRMYTTLLSSAQHLETLKGSEFLTYAVPVASPQAALEWVKTVRRDHPDATHVCWAYRVGAAYRFSDDGEPSGTAGMPIYKALEGSGLDCVAVAVVRYYGGTKLGAGGLARAYGGGAAEALRTAPRLEVRPRVHILLSVPFEFSSALFHLLESVVLEDRQDTYTEAGLTVQAWALEDDVNALELSLRDATRGRGELRVLDQNGTQGVLVE